MASRMPQMDSTHDLNSLQRSGRRGGAGGEDEEIMFNPAEHKDLAHFFSHVDQAETFALTANEWLGIKSGGVQFNPVGSVGPAPSKPNTALRDATRSLMAFNTPVSPSPPLNPLSNSAANGSMASTTTSGSSGSSVRAWRPHEVPFDPTIHKHSSEHELARRRSTTSSSTTTKSARESSMDGTNAAGQRKRPAGIPHADSLPSKRARSISQSTQELPGLSSSRSAPTMLAPVNVVAGPSSAPPVASSSAGGGSAKPPLLTAQQKKANHILSEQKRRAKIRRGYDALCDVVPSLRSAVQAEQENTAADAKKKRGKGAKANVDVDGRSGPKSESIVLSQTIEYMEHLVSRKEELLSRLQNAQNALPPDQRRSDENERAIWEKEWDGGTGIEDGEEDDEESDDEDTA